MAEFWMGMLGGAAMVALPWAVLEAVRYEDRRRRETLDQDEIPPTLPFVPEPPKESRTFWDASDVKRDSR